MYRSETDKIRHLIKPYLKGKGIDIGFGGDKVSEDFDGSDLPQGYAHTGNDKNNIPADITQGLPVEDETYDTVYSSHLIEDFENTKQIAEEHLRILKKGGNLILVFPDEQKFREHCKITGQPWNSRHYYENMGMEFMKEALKDLPVTWEYENDCEVDYNVILVGTKK